MILYLIIIFYTHSCLFIVYKYCFELILRFRFFMKNEMTSTTKTFFVRSKTMNYDFGNSKDNQAH